MKFNSWVIVLIGVLASGFISIVTRMAANAGIDVVSFSVSTLIASVFLFCIFLYF